MPQFPQAPRIPLARALLLAGAVAATLTGCGAGGAPAPTASSSQPAGTPSEQATASASPADSPEIKPSAAPVATPTPITTTCLDLVSLQTMYDFDPNFGLEAAGVPAGGTFAATAVANAGVACSWVQQSSGAKIVISLAQPAPAVLATLRKDAGASGNRTETFATAGDDGTAQVFDGGFWLTATSSYFASADDARPLIDSAMATLPPGGHPAG